MITKVVAYLQGKSLVGMDAKSRKDSWKGVQQLSFEALREPGTLHRAHLPPNHCGACQERKRTGHEDVTQTSDLHSRLKTGTAGSRRFTWRLDPCSALAGAVAAAGARLRVNVMNWSTLSTNICHERASTTGCTLSRERRLTTCDREETPSAR